MNTRFFVLSLLLTLSVSLQAQQTTLVAFDEPIADLGTIIDNQGAVSHRFSFVNNSQDPVAVEKVSTSCGCTSTNWSQELIGNGSEGFVEVQFDPYNRPGPFEKQAIVHFEGWSDSLTLVVKGFVKPAPASMVEAYPVKMGALRVQSRFLDLGTITGRSLYSKSFDVYNESAQILVFSDDMAGPNHITVTYEPYTLKPGKTGKMWVHYDITAKRDLGYFSEDIGIFTYEDGDSRKDFTVTATLLDLPASASAESPKVSFDKTEIDFGIRQQGDTINVVFPVRNNGRTKLSLKKIFGNCNCIQVRPNALTIDPGEDTEIAVRFTTDERLGNQEKTVTVFTDDPLLPVAILKIKGRLRGSRN